MRSNHLPVFEDPHTLVSLGDDDCAHMQSVLLSMLEREEGDIDLLEPANVSEVYQKGFVASLPHHLLPLPTLIIL